MATTTTTATAELCADCYRTKPICGWHLDPDRHAVLGFCHDCSQTRYERTGVKVLMLPEPRPYRWL